MKKILKNTFIVAVFLLLVFSFNACKENIKQGDKSPVLDIIETSCEINKGENKILNYVAENLSQELTWRSSNTTVATVNNGIVTAVNEGECSIIVICGELQDECFFKVIDESILPVISNLEENINLQHTESKVLEPIVSYNGDMVSGAVLTWSSSNNNIVSVSHNGIITAVDFGEAVITLHVEYNSKEDWFTINVNVIEDIEIDLSKKSIQLKFGEQETETVTIKVLENGADGLGSIEWISLDSSVATVNNGVVSAVGRGETIVAVKYTSLNTKQYISNIKVEVNPQVVYTNEKIIIDLSDKNNVIKLDNRNYEKATVSINNDTIQGEFSGNTFVVNGTKLKTVAGEAVLTVCLPTVDYNYNLVLANGIINTKEDFYDMFDKAEKLADDANTYGGYWILGSDIQNFGKVKAIGDFASIFWNRSTKDVGWLGTFDGNGHSITGVEFEINSCGLFGSIGSTGLVKNLTVDCPKLVTFWTGLIGSEVWGTVENLRLIVETNTPVDDSMHTYGVLTKGIRDGATVQNVIIDVSAKTDYYTGFFTPLGDVECNNGVPLPTITIKDCYVLGYFKNEGVGGEGCPSCLIGQYGAISYASAGDKTSYFPTVKSYIYRDWGIDGALLLFEGDENDLSSFDLSVWELSGYKLPKMKSIDYGFNIVKGEDLGAYSKMELIDNKLDLREKFVDDISLVIYDGKIISTDGIIDLNVYPELIGEFRISVICVDANIKYSDAKILISNQYTLSTEKIDIGLFNTEGGNVEEMDVSQYFADKNILQISVNGIVVSDTGVINWANDLSYRGELTLRILCEKDGHYYDYTNVQVFVIDGVVTTVKELTEMFAVAETLIEGDNTFGGYWILGKDINDFGSLNRIADYGTIFWQRSLKELGWLGTFDGRGHTISGIDFHMEGCGIFGNIGVGGCVKNLTINCPSFVTAWTGIICAELWGSVENIHIIVETKPNQWDMSHTYGILTKGIRDGATINNVIIDVSAQTDYATGFFTVLGDVECDVDGKPLSTITIENCYVLGYFKNEGIGGEGCPSCLIGRYGAISYASSGDKTSYFPTVKSYIYRGWGIEGALSLFEADENDLSSFNSEVWNKNGYSLPQMKEMPTAIKIYNIVEGNDLGEINVESLTALDLSSYFSDDITEIIYNGQKISSNNIVDLQSYKNLMGNVQLDIVCEGILTKYVNVKMYLTDGRNVSTSEQPTEIDLISKGLIDYLVADTEKEQIEQLDNINGEFLDYQVLELPINDTLHNIYDIYISDDCTFKNVMYFKSLSTTIKSNIYLIPNVTYYYKVYSGNEFIQSGAFISKDYGLRYISADGIRNFRDLGGWDTADGDTTAYGKIYRSADLQKATESGIDVVINKLGIKTEIDLRTDGTKTALSNFLNYYQCPIYSNIFNMPTLGYCNGTVYANVSNSMKMIFDILSNEENYPIIFHCNAGADRTGFLAFIINGLCGVGYEDLTKDYELTSTSIYGIRCRANMYDRTTGELLEKFDNTLTQEEKDLASTNCYHLVYETLMKDYGEQDGLLSTAIKNYLIELGVSEQKIDSAVQLLLANEI